MNKWGRGASPVQVSVMPEAPTAVSTPDEILVALARQGDRPAREELFRGWPGQLAVHAPSHVLDRGQRRQGWLGQPTNVPIDDSGGIPRWRRYG